MSLASWLKMIICNIISNVLNAFRSCYLNQLFCKFSIYFSKYYRPLGSWSALVYDHPYHDKCDHHHNHHNHQGAEVWVINFVSYLRRLSLGRQQVQCLRAIGMLSRFSIIFPIIATLLTNTQKHKNIDTQILKCSHISDNTIDPLDKYTNIQVQCIHHRNMRQLLL